MALDDAGDLTAIQVDVHGVLAAARAGHARDVVGPGDELRALLADERDLRTVQADLAARRVLVLQVVREALVGEVDRSIRRDLPEEVDRVGDPVDDE